MSPTPPKTEGVEQAQSPDEEQPMDRNAEETQAQGLGYEFEVKEQDRWLPIANGAYYSSLLCLFALFSRCLGFAPFSPFRFPLHLRPRLDSLLLAAYLNALLQSRA